MRLMTVLLLVLTIALAGCDEKAFDKKIEYRQAPASVLNGPEHGTTSTSFYYLLKAMRSKDYQTAFGFMTSATRDTIVSGLAIRVWQTCLKTEDEEVITEGRALIEELGFDFQIIDGIQQRRVSAMPMEYPKIIAAVEAPADAMARLLEWSKPYEQNTTQLPVHILAVADLENLQENLQENINKWSAEGQFFSESFEKGPLFARFEKIDGKWLLSF